ncbi:MAG: efflux RND transporter periplasmic adaptor subunit, partial [Coriobacteriia bacterium]|nr:efflux RND transporter periplasmic adaptor subunit [Coriobacteriia bacterium]
MARRRRWKRYRGWIAVAALLAVAAAGYAVIRRSANAETGPTYVAEAAEAGTLSVTVSGTGNLQVRDEVEVWASTSGTVAELKVAEGDEVEAGDVLFTLDGSSAETERTRALASLRQSEESVARAALALAQAEDALDDLKERAAEASTRTPAVTEAQIDAAERQVEVAKAGLTSAKASLAGAQLSYRQAADALDALVVKAPCDGVVWTVGTAEGASVTARSGGSSSGSSSGTSAQDAMGSSGSAGDTSGSGSSAAPVTIARDGELAVDLGVNETDVSGVAKGQSAELTFDAVPDLTITGKVDRVASKGTVSQGVVTYDVRVTLDVSDDRLRSGMSSTVVIVTQVVRDALLVPNAAVKTGSEEGAYVQVLADGGEPRRVAVETGPSNATKTVVTAGLQAGERVVTQTIEAASASGSGQSSAGGGSVFGTEGMGRTGGAQVI